MERERSTKRCWRSIPTIAGGGALSLIAFVFIGCAERTLAPFWHENTDYSVLLVVQDRRALLPELERAAAPLRDSTEFTVSVRAVAKDSLFGSYMADFRNLGIMVGAVEPPNIFAGRFTMDSVFLEIAPNATDAGLILRGAIDDGHIVGVWHTEAGSTSGMFTLRRE